MNEVLQDKAPGAIRIVTWNVGTGTAKKIDRVKALEADVAVLCEVRNEGRLRKAGQDSFRTMDWVGRFPTRGLAVMGFGKWRTKMYASKWDQRIEWNLPTKVTGPDKQRFNLIGCWAFNKRAHFDPSDFRQSQGAQLPGAYPKLFMEPTVVAGDFNNNVKMSKPGNPRYWGRMVDEMAAAGLKSAYHSFFAEQQGEETRETHWWQRSTEKTFHIDHCFVPKEWHIAQVWVGGPEDWLRKGDGSDHAPLVVDVVPRNSEEVT